MSTIPTTGRRAARRRRRTVDRLSAAGAALLAVAAVLLLTADVVEAGREPVQRTGAVPVEETTSACAAFPGPGAGKAFTTAAPVELPGQSGHPGTVVAGPVGGRSEPVDGPARGRTRSLAVATGPAARAGWALRVTATGTAAVGRTTFEVDRAPDADALGVQECLRPRARWWFTGGGADLDHSSTLLVANPDPGPAVVDIEVHGAAGPVDSIATRGVTLPAGEVHAVDLVEVAPQADELAIRVEASRGRVVAALADSFATRPAAVAGREWIPAQAEPSRRLRLAPLPARADRRTLVVANPSDREALAHVEVVGKSGTFVPSEVPQLRVPPGSVVSADLGDAVGGEASAVVVRSRVRLTGTVRSARDVDVTYAAASPVLAGPAAVLLPDGGDASLQLTARDQAATAEVVAYSAAGEEVDTAELEIAPGVTLSWKPGRRARYLVVTPGEGRLFGGVSLSGGAGLSQVPLRPLLLDLRRPVVTPAVR